MLLRQLPFFMVLVCTYVSTACGELLLKHYDFPKSGADLHYADTMDSKSADYDKYDYGSAYTGFEIEEIKKKSETFSPSATTPPTPTNQVQIPIQTQTQTQPNNQQKYAGGDLIGHGELILSNNTFNGPCTWLETERHFHNDIVATDRFDNKDPAFAKAMMNFTRLRRSCGNDSRDAGGFTCCGIAQNSHPGVDIANLTVGGAEDIYWNEFYIKYGMDKLPDVARTVILPFASSAGTGTALSKTREALGLPKSSAKVDQELVNAMINYKGDLHNFLLDVYEKHYKSLHNAAFSKGWLERIRYLRENGCHTIPKNPVKRTSPSIDRKCSSFK